MKTRYVNDPISGQMYDIIRSNLTYDLGRIFDKPLGGTQSVFKNAIKNNNPNYAASAKQSSRIFETKIQALMNVFSN